MKKIIILVAFVLTGIFVGCEDDYEAPNSFSDIGWYTSALREAEFNTNIDEFISFSDLSQGTVEHRWTIGEGNYYLEGPISRTDSVYEEFIIDQGVLVSEDPTVHVLFKQSGLQEVNLYNTFNDSVTFKGVKGSEEVIFPSKKVGDKWVIDTTFVVDVYDTIVPAMIVKQNGVVVPHESESDIIYIEAGDNLEFIDATVIGRPNTWFWNVGGSSSSEQNATLVFKKLGSFKGTFAVSRTGQSIPGDYEQYKIPATFEVIPSSKPFEIFSDLIELEDETIQIPFNGEFAPFTGQEEFFVVKVNDVEFTVASVTIDEDDATILNLKLADPIYRPDVVTVSLLDGSAMESTDTRSPVPFSDLPVIMHYENLMEPLGASFEDNGATWLPRWDNKGTLEYTTEQASDGEYSLKITTEAGQQARIQSGKFNLEGGKTYLITFDIFFTEGSSYSSFSPWLIPNWKQLWTGASGYPKGEWATVTKEWTPGADELERMIFFYTNGGTGTIYLDNWFVVEKEVRP